MRTFNKSLLTAAFIGGVALALPMASQAQIQVTVFDGTNSVTYVDGSSADTDGLVNNAINVDPNTLNLNFASLSVNSALSSSFFLTSAGTIMNANQNLDFVTTGAAGAGTSFTVTTTGTGFTIPQPEPRRYSSTASFTDGQPGTASTFQGGVSTTNTAGVNTNNDTLLGFTSTSGNLSGGQTATGFVFSNGNAPYAQTIVSTVTLSAGQEAQIGGTIRIRPTAVPEPGSIAMIIGMGVSGSAFVLRRRRK